MKEANHIYPRITSVTSVRSASTHIMMSRMTAGISSIRSRSALVQKKGNSLMVRLMISKSSMSIQAA